MTVLKCWLRLLFVLTLLTAQNVFAFDSRQRKFEISRSRYYIVGFVQNIVLIPISIIFAFLAILATWSAIAILFHPESPDYIILGTYFFCAAFLVFTKIGPPIYVRYMFKCHIKQLLELLNSFVRSYDEYKDLFTKPPQINWILLTLLINNFAVFNGLAYFVLVSTGKKLNFYAVYLLSLPSVIISAVVSFALLLLQAFYNGSCQDTGLSNGRRLRKLLKFYERIRRLRRDLAEYLKIFAAIDICMSLLTITWGLFCLMRRDAKYEFLAMTAVGFSYVLLFTHITNGLSIAEYQIGSAVLQHHSGISLLWDQKLQLFYLDRLCVERRLEEDITNVLHLRKPIVLCIVDYSITFAIFLGAYDVVNEFETHPAKLNSRSIL